MIVLRGGVKNVQVNEEAVKGKTYEELEEMFKGKLDYKQLAKILGVKPAPKTKKGVSEKKSNSPEKSEDK